MKEPKVFLIHGFEGVPNGGWRPWLMGKLGREDIFACSLSMPSPATPKKEEWIQKIKSEIPEPNENIFLVGHSLAVNAILQYLQELPSGTKIGGAVLVSGPYKGKREILQGFFEPDYDFVRIKNACKNFAIIHGDNDPGVPFSDAEKFAHELTCELIPIPNGGHLNGSSGWYELPEAFTALMNWLKPKT